MFCLDEKKDCFQALEDVVGKDFFGQAPRISLVGGGGKTTTLFRLRDYFRRMGRSVIMTTTTKMRREERPWFLLDPDQSSCVKSLSLYGQVFAARKDVNSGKVCAPSMSLLGQLYLLGLPVIAEADGAKERPVKAPAAHEPVLLPDTTHLIAVYGLSALGRPLREAGFRLEEMCRILHKERDDVLEAEDIARLALSEAGGSKGLTEGMKFGVVLNQTDTRRQVEAALQIRRLIEERKDCFVWITGRGRI